MRFTAGVMMVQFYMLLNVPPSAAVAPCVGSALNVTMPSKMQAISGMCLLVPCSFDPVQPHSLDVKVAIIGVWLKSTHDFGDKPESVIFKSNKENDMIEMVGNMSEKNCTTRFHNVNPSQADNYYFRVENKPEYQATDTCNILNISVHAPTPSILTKGTLAENHTVSFTCQALNPCPSQPPQLSLKLNINGVEWKPHETRTDASLQWNVTLSDQDNGLKLTCLAVYPPKDSEGSNITAEYSVELNVSYSPKNTTASFEETSQRVNLTCTSRANPQVDNFTWFRRSDDGPKNVYEGSLYSFNKSENDEIFYCMATNPLGYQNSTDIKITISSKGLIGPLLVGGLFGIVFFIGLIICVLCLWKKGSTQRQVQQPQGSASQLAEEIHYGEIDFTKRGAVQNPGMAHPQGGEVTSEYAEITPGKARNTQSP